MKINSPEAEKNRAAARAQAGDTMELCAPTVPYWQASSDVLALHRMMTVARESIARELQYLRIIKSLGKPPKPRKCAACAKRKRQALVVKDKSKFREANREECLRIMASIEECWPGWRKVPDLLWNQYIDAAGICRCGRVIAPKRISKSVHPVHCSREHAAKWQTKKNRARKRAFGLARKALKEEME